jgi:hypothetical protein
MIEDKQILVTEPRMAKMLGLSVPYMIKLRKLRKIPYLKIGESVRYDPRKVEKALERFTIEEEI